MKFIADFHIHSRFSRATSQKLDFENLYIAAQIKGITVVGTGDFTHPKWISEIKEKLIPAEQGLFRLKEDIAAVCDKEVPQNCRSTVRFMLSTEISNIYKKDHKTRKNHNLIVVPDIETAIRFSERLDAVGNIHSDGRPILGLDAKNLLEILIETSERAYLIPAHIWTPWFSVMGSKSGFDSIEECFEELSEHIFAVETGLSSDPGMNWRVSCLDKYTLISNSDAHSPMNMGREANIFNTDLSYDHIFSAIKTRNENTFLGTYEFYPEEGKYHLDGHRKCDVRFTPKESEQNGGVCPKCGKPLTLGVLYRVEELADRPEHVKSEKHPPYYNAIPLTGILSEILETGPQSKIVQNHYRMLINEFGSEYDILHGMSSENLKRSGVPLLAEAISRMRSGKLFIDPGYDGEFGRVQIFNPGEKKAYMGQKSLFINPQKEMQDKKASHKDRQPESLKQINISKPSFSSKTNEVESQELNSEQLQAVQAENKALLIVAGPGTGKTMTLTRRIGYLIKNRNVSPDNILAVTFTNKAAREMKERVVRLNADAHKTPLITTFHGLCYKILKERNRDTSESSAARIQYTVIDETEQLFYFTEAVELFRNQGGKVPSNPSKTLERIRSAKQMLWGPAEIRAGNLAEGDDDLDVEVFSRLYELYQQLLSHQRRYDFEDLIRNTVKLLESDPAVRRTYQDRFRFIFVDEFQDINLGQHRLLQLLATPATHLFVIGDPDQSIYGFRGSDTKFFKRFVSDFSDTRVIKLTKNYRSTRTIVDAANQVISARRDAAANAAAGFEPKIADVLSLKNVSNKKGFKTVTVIAAASDRAEAVAVGKIIESMVGGTGFHFIDFNTKEPENAEPERSFSEFAVLYRTGIQGKIFSEVFSAAGIPYQIVNRDSLFSGKEISEILSLLRIFAEAASFLDLEHLKNLVSPGLSRVALKHFRNWSFENQMSLRASLMNARRFPIPGMSKSHQQQLGRFLERLDQLRHETDQMTVRETINYLFGLRGLRPDDQPNAPFGVAFQALMDLAEAYDRRLADFITALALQTDTDMYLPRSERVALLTMHAAKGLEFPVVFICGCENGYIPLIRTGHEPSDLEEEKRLFYVAMTRAKERLFISHAKYRRVYGKKESRHISPFIGEIDHGLKGEQAAFDGNKKTRRQLQLF